MANVCAYFAEQSTGDILLLTSQFALSLRRQFHDNSVNAVDFHLKTLKSPGCPVQVKIMSAVKGRSPPEFIRGLTPSFQAVRCQPIIGAFGGATSRRYTQTTPDCVQRRGSPKP